jgi:hypothetical protein
MPRGKLNSDGAHHFMHVYIGSSGVQGSLAVS